MMKKYFIRNQEGIERFVVAEEGQFIPLKAGEYVYSSPECREVIVSDRKGNVLRGEWLAVGEPIALAPGEFMEEVRSVEYNGSPAFAVGLSSPEPPPVANDNPAVWDLVMKDMQDRDQEGRRKYSVPLQPHNGRKPLIDAYQEALDLVVYLRQEIFERHGK